MKSTLVTNPAERVLSSCQVVYRSTPGIVNQHRRRQGLDLIERPDAELAVEVLAPTVSPAGRGHRCTCTRVACCNHVYCPQTRECRHNLRIRRRGKLVSSSKLPLIVPSPAVEFAKVREGTGVIRPTRNLSHVRQRRGNHHGQFSRSSNNVGLSNLPVIISSPTFNNSKVNDTSMTRPCTQGRHS